MEMFKHDTEDGEMDEQFSGKSQDGFYQMSPRTSKQRKLFYLEG